MTDSTMELSIVMPCLNEAETVGACIQKAQGFLERSGILGEVVVSDNGSTDGSIDIAESMGARVINAPIRGYGGALIAGINGALGKFVIMGDADDSYDFSLLGDFVTALRAGDELVMGNRFAGGIEPGAMPPLHRYLGNPILSFIGQLFFPGTSNDFHCGLRGFDRKKMLSLGLTCPGMEFASEMVVKASLGGLRITEVPIKLHPDGRGRAPHLNSWRDGWRHLRFLLLFSPRWIFLYPGLLLFTIGIVLSGFLVMSPITLGSVVFDINTLLYTAVCGVIGLQMLIFGVLMRLLGSCFGNFPAQPQLDRFVELFSLEKGLLAGSIAIIAGLAWTLNAVLQWGDADFSTLDPQVAMRHTIPAVTLMIMGVQTILASFFLSALALFDESQKVKG